MSNRERGPVRLSDIHWTPPDPPPALVERWQRDAERRTAGPRMSADQHRLAVWLRTALVRIPVAYRPDAPADLVRRLSPALRAEAERWAPAVGWVVTGPTGVGKTSAVAYALVRRIAPLLSRPTLGPEASALCGLVWTTASALCSARSRWPLGRGDAPEVERAVAAPVLVLDDLGWEPDAGAIGDVLAARYDAGRPLVVTTGRAPAELAARYGAAVARRLVECSRGGAVTSLWPPPPQNRPQGAVSWPGRG